LQYPVPPCTELKPEKSSRSRPLRDLPISSELRWPHCWTSVSSTIRRPSATLSECANSKQMQNRSSLISVHLRQMLIESTPEHIDKNVAEEQISKLLTILEERKAFFQKRRVSVINLISAPSVQRFLQLGLIGSFNVPAIEIPARRRAAQVEVENLINIMSDEPMGIQIGVIEHTMPNVTFQLFRKPKQTVLALSPFRLGETPDIQMGVAMITASQEAVGLYESMSSDLWRRSRKGREGAAMLKVILDHSVKS
jgi:hypothetical protein